MRTEGASTHTSWRVRFEILATFAMVVAASAMLWAVFGTGGRATDTSSARDQTIHRTEPSSLPSEPISMEGMHLLGVATAQAVVIEYCDFQCPFCGRFARETWPVIKTTLVDPGTIRIAFAQMPIAGHHQAFGAAVASECAADQGLFWPLHDSLFADQSHLDDAGLRFSAKRVGLDLTSYDGCISSSAVLARISHDAEAARTVAVSGTPTFFIGETQPDGRVKVTKRMSGFLTPQQFADAIARQPKSAIGHQGQ
jgi:protein-disulfide isomerase